MLCPPHPVTGALYRDDERGRQRHVGYICHACGALIGLDWKPLKPGTSAHQRAHEAARELARRSLEHYEREDRDARKARRRAWARRLLRR